LTVDALAASQPLGDAAHYLGIKAVLAPSAAGPGSALAIYTDRLQPASSLVAHLIGAWQDAPGRLT